MFSQKIFQQCFTKAPELFECELCNFNTTLKVDLTEHRRVFHEGKEVNKELHKIHQCYRCKNCDFGTHALVVLAKHLIACKTRNNPNREVKIEDSKTEDEWYELTTPAGAKWLKCKVCVLITRNIDDMKNHVLNEHADGINWFKCQQCGYKAKAKRNLRHHIKTKHTKLEKKEATGNSNIGNGDWYELQTPGGINWFKCKHCVLITRAVADMENHVLLEHAGAKNVGGFTCTDCAFRTEIEEVLQWHIMRNHPSNEDFPVENEKWHELRTPGGVRWLKCKQCVLITREIGDMETHVLLEHADGINGPKFKCPQCTFETAQHRGLRLHISVKHGVKDTGLNV